MDKTLILDISSDDDVGFDDSSTADNFDWISKLFDDTPLDNDLNFVGNGCGGDDDDVVVVGETIPNPKKAKVSLSKCGFNDDDDCVVLDCDPDKKDKVETKNCDDRGGGGGGGDNDDDDDELVIVGEKGQVACRDYPHSRHLCAKFPFSSTPHESRCDLCHCYVCDSLAPCAYWGSGVSSIDHCHANDKEEYWQLERKKVRQSKNGPTPITKPSAAPVLRLPRLPQNSLRAHQTTRTPSTCGVPSSFGRPNIISQGKTLRPNMTMARTRFQPHLVSQQLVRTCNSSIQSNRGPTLPSMHPAFKRCGYPNRGPSEHLRQVVNRRANSNVNTCLTNSTSTNGLSSPSPAFGQISGFQGCGIPSATSDSLYVSTSVNQIQNVPSPTIFQYSSDSPTCDTPSSQQPSAVISDCLYVSTSVNQAQNVSSPTILQYSSGSPNCETPSSQQPCAVISDSLYVSTSVNQMQYVSSPGVVHQYSIDAPNCDAQSNQQPTAVTSTLVNESLNVSNPSILQYSYGSNCYTQSNQQPSVVLSNITDLTSHGHPSSAPNCIAENIQQPSNVTHNLSHPTFTCQQPSVQSSSFQSAIRQPCMNGLQVQGALPLHDLSSLNEQNPPLSCNASSSPLDLDIESWLSDNEPIIGSHDGSYFCDMNNNQPAVTAPVDTGMLYFDFETSWKGLTHS